MKKGGREDMCISPDFITYLPFEPRKLHSLHGLNCKNIPVKQNILALASRARKTAENANETSFHSDFAF